MKVLVVGANGQIGRHLVRLLSNSREHEVRAMVRNDEQAQFFQEQGVETVVADLEGTVEEIRKAAEGCEAIVFTAGSGSHTGPDKTILVDLDGAVKTIEAAEQANIKRFIMVSALSAHIREKWREGIKHYFAAKHYADRMLMSSQLNYTIIRPGRLLNEPGTGKISVGEQLERGSIPREDVAATIVASLNEENTLKRGFDVISGETPITDALKNMS
ncbi:putative sugar epimerase YhfK [Caldalkalibacillus thermarum]|uniref:SDR family oxidoreductase n=1 Tax=Caldalkalibacillus thermarum TaxID=296745 RepID=UPI001666EAA8|nr:SDR family oxidoreductase [Caldalkalibacillus thermarum]GGK35201.1 putative sugar epimerase YhfK [Caldalkalibacillus thermarum]